MGLSEKIFAQCKPVLLPLQFAVLGVCMWLTRGHYALWPIVAAGLVFATFAASVFLGDDELCRPKRAVPPSLYLIVSVIVVFLLLGVDRHHIIYLSKAGAGEGITSVFVVILVLSGALFASRDQRLLWPVVFGLFVVKILVIVGSPSPHIDVYSSNTQAVQHFLSGVNPYSQTYRDIYGGAYDYTPGFAYWPAVLYAQTIGYGLFGDIRAAFVLADVATFAGLLLLFRELGVGFRRAVLAAILWFAFPVSLFVLEQAWVDPLLVTFCVYVFYFVRKNNFVASGVFLGLLCATKQYGIILAALVGVFYLLSGSRKDLLKLAAVSAGVFLLLVAPFAVWDFRGFYRMTVATPLSALLRTDSFSIAAVIARHTGWSPGGGFYLAATAVGFGLGAAAVFKYRKRPEVGIPCGAALAYTFMFLFGKQAFCNYYYFAAFLLVPCLGLLLRGPLEPDRSRSRSSQKRVGLNRKSPRGVQRERDN